MGVALDPSWVGTVATPFRSAAASIEGHYRTLDGDADELERCASLWHADADRLDAIREPVDASRREAQERWTGDGADGFADRARRWVAEVATSAESLRFAADGLTIAASTMSEVQRGADNHIRWYVGAVNTTYARFRSLPALSQHVHLARTIAHVNAIGWSTLRAVHAEARRLDHVLASMPRRFQVGPGAPWRSGLSPVVAEQRSASWSGAFTIPFSGSPVGVRISRSEGMIVTQDDEGRIVIGLRDSYGAGPHASGGTKTSFDELPAGWKNKLNRAYGEIEGGAAVSYVRRYKFSSVDEAQEFVDRLEGTTVPGRVASAARGALGYYAGPAADFGELSERLIGRAPDETAVSVGLTAKASVDAGLPPVLSDRASAAGALSGVYTERADGGKAVGWVYEGEQKTGLTAGYDTTVVGGSRSVLHRTDYNTDGIPTAYVRQVTTVGDYEYDAGTNGSYVGAKRLPGSLPGGYTKVDLESATRQVETTSLDLADEGNRAAHRAAGAGAPWAGADRELRQRLDDEGLVTVRRYALDRTAAELSGRVAGFGAKAGPQIESQELVDAWYVDPDGERRPIPADPRLPGDGRIDVPDPTTPTG